MGTKVVQVDGGAGFKTLPGGTGEAKNQASQINDTVFGQSYKSSETGLIGWDVQGQAFYKGFAGYVAKILKGGSPTGMVTEAMALVSGKTYRITNALKRILDASSPITILDTIPVAIAAKALLTFVSNAEDGDTVTINGRAYTFVDALSSGPTVAYEVLIGVDAEETAINLRSAINAGAGGGVEYSVGTVIHPTVTASTAGGSILTATAKVAGTGGNALTVSANTPNNHYSWNGLTLTGGAASSTTDVTAHVTTWNYLFGEITFENTFTPTGSIVATGNYLPTTALGHANSYTLTQTAEAIETTDFEIAQGNGGFRTFESGLRTVQMELSGFYDITPGFRAALQNRDLIIIEINPDGNGKSLARGYFKLSDESQSGAVGALEEEKVTFMLQVPSSDYTPFGWHHESDTTLHASIKAVLDAWLNEDTIDVKYLYDGTNGFSGTAVVTEASMQGALDSMNEFTCKFQGTDANTDEGTG